MASKSSRRRKRAARRGPAERAPSTTAVGSVSNGPVTGVSAGSVAPNSGLMAKAQGFFSRALAPIPGTIADDPPGSPGRSTRVADAGPSDTDITDTGSTDASTGGPLEFVGGASAAGSGAGDLDVSDPKAGVPIADSPNTGGGDGAALETTASVSADDDVTPARRWGLGDAIGGWAVAQVASIFAIASVVTALGYPKVAGVGAAAGQAVGQTRVDVTVELLNVWGQLPIEFQVLLQVPLWLGLIGAPVYAARRKGTSLRKDFGLSVTRTDVPVGLVIGVACQLVLVPLVYVPFRLLGGDSSEVSEPAQQLVSSAVSPLGVVLLLLIVGAGAPFAEELFYRGLVQRSLLNRLGRPAWAIILSAMFFAFAHMQSLQFPALVVVGAVFGVLAWRSGRLGLSIFAHVGFNLTTAAVFLFDLTPPFV